MTLVDLIGNLQDIERQHGGSMPVFTIHGASGVSDEIGHPFWRDGNAGRESDQGALMDHPEGEAYVWIYTGN